jgi:hypothetical protein
LAATYITKAELRVLLGIGSLYSDSVVEEVCSAAENIVKGYLWFNDYNVIARECTTTLATIYTDQKHNIQLGETVTVENVAAHYNGGNKTVTAITEYSISYAISHVSAETKRVVRPYGTISAATNVDYSTVPEIRQGSAMIAVDIWQARQASNAGGISPDFQPSPYRMGNTLTARIRGLIANHLSPNSLVG